MGEQDNIPGRDGYPFVFVDWVDSCENADNADINIYDLPEPQRIFQCGFLVHDEEGFVVIAGAVKPANETYDYCIAVPRVAINAIRYLGFSTETQEAEG